MTLSKHRPLRTYDEQWIQDATDVHGLLKDMDGMVERYREAGLLDSIYVEGARDALEILFGDEDIDTRLDFVNELKNRMKERRE